MLEKGSQPLLAAPVVLLFIGRTYRHGPMSPATTAPTPLLPPALVRWCSLPTTNWEGAGLVKEL